MKDNVYLIESLLLLLDKKHSLHDLIHDISNEYIHIYKKNETIINVKDPIDYIYFLLDGSASVWGEVEWTNNIIAYLHPLEILGLLEILNNIKTYTAFVMAESDCITFRVRKDEFMEIIQSHCEICYKTLKILGKMTSNNMEEYAIKKLFSHDDIIGYYFYLQAKHNLPYTCYYTRSELSEILNINLRTLYRHIFVLEKKGYLKIKKGKIIITESNFEKLMERYEDIII